MPQQMKLPARIFLVEDHPAVRQQVAARIECEPDLVVCGEAEDADTALGQIVQILPDLVLLDLSLKNSSGFELLKNLQILYPDLTVLVLSMQDSPVLAQRSLLAGARGYITKQEAIHHLLGAIRAVLAGRLYHNETENTAGRCLINQQAS